MVYCTWIEDIPDAYRERPALWRDALDKVMEPKLTLEELAEQEAEDAARAQAKKDREWETWGESPEQLAAQERFMAMAGPEG